MYQFLDVEEFSPVRVIATVAKSYLHSPTPEIHPILSLTVFQAGRVSPSLHSAITLKSILETASYPSYVTFRVL
jgi:hypothetical protein